WQRDTSKQQEERREPDRTVEHHEKVTLERQRPSVERQTGPAHCHFEQPALSAADHTIVVEEAAFHYHRRPSRAPEALVTCPSPFGLLAGLCDTCECDTAHGRRGRAAPC